MMNEEMLFLSRGRRLVHTGWLFGMSEGGTRNYLEASRCQPKKDANIAFRQAPDRGCTLHHTKNTVSTPTCQPIDRTDKAQHLQLEPWISTWKKRVIGRHIAGKWHIITLQQAIEYLEHDFLTNRFHLTHYSE